MAKYPKKDRTPEPEPPPESDAKLVARVIGEMESRSGRLVVPERLVEEAKLESHPLHHKFPWDDAEAAHQHRITIARQLIKSVRIVVTHSTKRITSVAYVRDPSLPPRMSGYVSVARLKNETDNAMDAMQIEVDRVVAALERAREIAAALDLVAEFDDTWHAAQALRARMRKGRPHGSEEVHVH